MIEHWIYRHSEDIRIQWGEYLCSGVDFIEKVYSVEDVLSIDKHDMDLDFLDQCDGYVQNYIYKHGSFPQPIIVAVDPGHINHPMDPGKMKSPKQLIEGNTRLKVFRALNEKKHTLEKRHMVWEMSFSPDLVSPIFYDNQSHVP